ASAGDESLAGLSAGLSALVRAYFKDCLVTPLVDVAVEERPLLLSSMQDWIRGQLHHADLDAQVMGRYFHCSRSTVYALFKPYGGVRAYVQSLRLERARERLCSPGVGKILIGRLAIHLGFSSVAVFSRAFRERWGMSPKEMRAQFLAAQGRNSFSTNNSACADSAQLHREQLKHACENYYATFRRDSSVELQGASR
ncbi:helix-turn-helix transcriptional regulator, partial [Cyanobium sp. BA20m-p-22]|uniref:helix-turn-helix transcriptional regulator n=1 Tax=Cyanobium sp. BA20m-p-22 TaxID=2823704 RepID=UPI0020CEE969